MGNAYTILDTNSVCINKHGNSIYLDDAEFDAIVAEVAAFRAQQREQRIAKLKAEADELGLCVSPKPLAERIWGDLPAPPWADDPPPLASASTQSPFGFDKEDDPPPLASASTQSPFGFDKED